MSAREALHSVVQGLMLGAVLWWLLDGDGQGKARTWSAVSTVAGALAFEFGQVHLAAERRYWEAVRS